MDINKIRNFGVIAHIDHGKTTLTDRIIELTLPKNKKNLLNQDRLTDVLAIEQERGITIKLQPVSFKWKGYTLNLIDTPGHVDFAYEVSRSLVASEGVILLVDATQGIQAQTISTLLSAMEHDLVIIPILNKVDIAKDLIDQRLDEIKQILGFNPEEVILASGKTGLGVQKILDTIIDKVPPPKNRFNIPDNKTAALIFDSFYNQHVGVVASVRIFKGTFSSKDALTLVNAKQSFSPKEIGIFTPALEPIDELTEGMVGYIATGIKEVRTVTIGDTISHSNDIMIPGYERPTPKVFASVYAAQKDEFLNLRTNLERLALNDASLFIQEDYSPILGQGFKVGFLGMLHLEITRERLKREFDTDTIITLPSVEYKVLLKTGKEIMVKTTLEMPEKTEIDTVYEPIVKGEIITPANYLGALYDLVRNYRGLVNSSDNLYSSAVQNITYVSLKIELPYSELIKGFFNALKAVSHGFASFQYNKIDYVPVEIVKVDILVNKEIVPSLSFLEVPEKARERAKSILKILKSSLNRQMFPVPLQGAIGGKIIARETIPAYKKNVTGKLYGGDITRKMKLLRNQSKKKKQLSAGSKVQVPSSAYIKIMRSYSTEGT